MKFVCVLSIFLQLGFNLYSQHSHLNKPGETEKRITEVYILAGQSNAVGYNNINTYKPGPFTENLKNQTQILFWPGSNAIASVKNSWTSLSIGLSKVGSLAFGPEITFGYEMAAARKEANIAIIKYAVGGTGIANSKDYSDYIPKVKNFDDKGNNWLPPNDGHPAGRLYQNLLSNINAALKKLDQKGEKYKLAGIIWMQGEHEAGLSRSMANDYQSLLNSFIHCLRKDLNKPNIPIVIGQISDKWIYKDIVKIAQQNICLNDSNIGMVITHDLPRAPNDNAHYTANGTTELGTRFARAMINLQNKENNN